MGAFVIVLLGVLAYHLLTSRHDATQDAINARPVPETLPDMAAETAESGGACLVYAIAVIALVLFGGLLLMATLAPYVAQYGH